MFIEKKVFERVAKNVGLDVTDVQNAVSAIIASKKGSFMEADSYERNIKTTDEAIWLAGWIVIESQGGF